MNKNGLRVETQLAGRVGLLYVAVGHLLEAVGHLMTVVLGTH
jgi:hypothetical protein